MSGGGLQLNRYQTGLFLLEADVRELRLEKAGRRGLLKVRVKFLDIPCLEISPPEKEPPPPPPRILEEEEEEEEEDVLPREESVEIRAGRWCLFPMSKMKLGYLLERTPVAVHVLRSKGGEGFRLEGSASLRLGAAFPGLSRALKPTCATAAGAFELRSPSGRVSGRADLSLSLTYYPGSVLTPLRVTAGGGEEEEEKKRIVSVREERGSLIADRPLDVPGRIPLVTGIENTFPEEPGFSGQ